MNKKVRLLIPVLLIVSIMLSSCGRNAPIISKPQSITLSFIYAGGDPITNQVTGEMIDAFNNSQHEVTINATASTSEPSTYEDFLKMRLALGEFPDFVEMRDTQTYVDAGKLAPLPKEIIDLLDDPPLVNGSVYTAPLWTSSPLGIIYNKDIFAKAGILEEPQTWEQFLTDCQRIKELGISPIVVGGKDLWHMAMWQGFFLGNYLYADNQNWNADRKAGKVHFTDKNVVDAMKDMTELWTKGYVDKAWLKTPDSQVVSILVSGKAAMLYEGTWMFSAIKQANPQFKLGFFAPRDRQGRVITIGKSFPQGYALSAKAGMDPDKVAAFVSFMKFFYSKAHYTNFLKISNGVATTKEKITYDAPEEMQKVLKITKDPSTINVLQMHNYWGENSIPSEFRDWLWRLTQQWLSSGTPNIEEAMKQADEQFDKQAQKTP